MLGDPAGDPNQRIGEMVCLSFQERRAALERQFGAAFAVPISGINVWNWMPVRREGCNLTLAPDDDPAVASIRTSRTMNLEEVVARGLRAHLRRKRGFAALGLEGGVQHGRRPGAARLDGLAGRAPHAGHS